MKKYYYPSSSEWLEIIKRPNKDSLGLTKTVKTILEDIQTRGDEALLEYELKFDNVKLDSLLVTAEEIEEAESNLSETLKRAIMIASSNIEKFHKSQAFETKKIETSPGVFCWQKPIGIDKVGLYIPGGLAPLFSTVLMLAIPAKLAGCNERILCTPPQTNGKVHPAILFAAKQAGVTAIYKLGGVQAIGAMAYGTETIPKVYKIFGPGNQYVTLAKQIVSLKDVAIDMPAGPSEVEVIADAYANPSFVASDFLSQAEHGRDSQSLLVTSDKAFVEEFEIALKEQKESLSRKEFLDCSLENSKIVVLKNEQEIIDFTNLYAPEHLIIQTNNYAQIASQIRNAGSVFLGAFSPESAGDYASGTNHTLPTNGYAKAYNGVNLDSFIRKITFQEITREGLEILGPHIQIMAENEQLDAHKQAVTVRLTKR